MRSRICAGPSGAFTLYYGHPTDRGEHLVPQRPAHLLRRRQHRPIRRPDHRHLRFFQLYFSEKSVHLPRRPLHERRMESPRHLQLYLPPTYTLCDILERIHMPGDDRLARRVEVGSNDRTARLFGSPLDVIGVDADQGDHPPRVLPCGLAHQAIPLGHQPHTIGETETPRCVGRRVLAERVAGYHVRQDPSLPQTVE
jgi:hypothetical protein